MSARPFLTACMVLLLVLAGTFTGGPAALSAGGQVHFGTPAASGAFGEEITFSTTFESEHVPDRVELLTRLPGDASEHVSIAAVEPTAAGWRAVVTQGGHIVPNTTWEYRFRVVTPEGEAIGPTAVHRVVDERFEWEVTEGEHVRVWTYEGGRDFAQRALDIAEGALEDAATLLSVDQMQPLDFLIYTDTRAFRQAMGPATRENIGGQAHPGIRTLFGLIEPRQIGSDWVEEVITHELAHLVFHEAVDNPYEYPPRWLNEGVAVYISRGHDAGDQAQVEAAAAGDTIIPLAGLGGNFPTRASRQGLAYAESIDAVEYLIESGGEAALVSLIDAFGDGLGLDGAFVQATGADFATFDAAWLQSLGVEPPEPFGPRTSQPAGLPEARAALQSALLPSAHP